MEGIHILLSYFLIINMAALGIMKADKEKARKNQYRIAESTLWLFAAGGGSLGAWMAMYLFRHKTRHLSFKLGFPLLALAHLFLLYLLLK
ncbi:DUF1294 domain-containing protein [Peribacillus sp. SCS-26]|uniref:DUF1294 domain-containing protein n=1 Tax=Paraperibacillus TaxID=3450404 RepID=UPI003906C04B